MKIVAKGTISRLINGQLAYVNVSGGGSVSFTPDRFALKSPDGSFRTYRGEPFAEFKVEEGSSVDIVSNDDEATDWQNCIMVITGRPNVGIVRKMLRSF